MMKKLKLNPLGNNRKILLMRGVFGTIALSMFFYTLQQIPLASAVTIQCSVTYLYCTICRYFSQRKMKLKQWIYFAIAFGGVALLKGFDDRVSLSFMLVGILSAMFSGIAYTCIRQLKRNRSSPSGGFLLSTNSHSYNGCFKLFSVGKTYRKGLAPTSANGSFTQIAQVLMTKGLQSAVVNKIISVKYIGTFWALAFRLHSFWRKLQLAKHCRYFTSYGWSSIQPKNEIW